MVSAGVHRDPLQLLLDQEAHRLHWLLPVRHSRMAESAFACFRGAAAVMAADLARESHSGLTVQLCGDAHLLNFGFFASPERQLLFGITDFDETYPGPYEWDVVRLATSVLLAARSNGFSSDEQEEATARALRSYAKAMHQFAAMPFMPMWVARLPLEPLIEERGSKTFRRHLRRVVASALHCDSRQAVRKLCETDANGELRFRHDPPLLWRHWALPSDLMGGLHWREWAEHLFETYKDTLLPEMRHFLSRYRLVDAALKAVGVGSVGMRCAVGLFIGEHPDDVLVLQSKQALPSVLAPYLPGPAPEHQGERVVQGQRLLQTASDVFLGWTRSLLHHDFYWRHFRDWKASVEVECLDAAGLIDYARLCGWTLAKAHARSGDRSAIAADLGKPKLFAQRLLPVAEQHARWAQDDHALLLEAIARGQMACSSDV
jgi:hypothetical protein